MLTSCRRIYLNLLAEVLRDTDPGGWPEALAFACELSTKDNLLTVFTAAIGQLPPDEWQDRLDEVRMILSERGFSLDAADMTQTLVKALRRAPKRYVPRACQWSGGWWVKRTTVNSLLILRLKILERLRSRVHHIMLPLEK